MLQALVAFLPVALTFPENPNSIDSPLAWNPLSTGIGKLPPNSLRAWWDASKLNANDIWWGYPLLYPSSGSCEGDTAYTVSGTQNSNILYVHYNNTFPGSALLGGIPVDGLLFKIEHSPHNQIYQIVSTVNDNTFIVSPNFVESFWYRRLVISQLVRWPDASGNREDMGFWSKANTYSPGIYMLDAASGEVFRNGYRVIPGNSNQRLSGITAADKLSLIHVGGWREPVVVHEILIAKGTLNPNQRTHIDGYLASKWNIHAELPQDHHYATEYAPQMPWLPSQLGNDLLFWLDANQEQTLWKNSSCDVAAQANDRIACWQDLSSYQRSLFSQNSNFSIFYTQENLPGIFFEQYEPGTRTVLATQNGATWLNNENFFIAMVMAKKQKASGNFAGYIGGPLRIGNQDFFPFPRNLCMGVGAIKTKGSVFRVPHGYVNQRSTLVLQGNVRNQLFYQPYFNKNIPSSLTTRSPPTYLHEQPYLVAMVAKFLTAPTTSIEHLFSTVMPYLPIGGGLSYENKYFSIGASVYTNGKFWVDQGYNDVDYDFTINAEPTIYLAWKKQSTDVPWVTVNGTPQAVLKRSVVGSGYLRISADDLTVLAMGSSANGTVYPFSGSIYEAMVLTGPNIKYGHKTPTASTAPWPGIRSAPVLGSYHLIACARGGMRASLMPTIFIGAILRFT
jgi:hypothetical protein